LNVPLKFIAAGTITIEMVQKAKGKVPTLPKHINKAMGKASNQLTGFNEVTWVTVSVLCEIDQETDCLLI